MTLSNTSSTLVEGWWMVIATVRLRLHTDESVSAIVNAVVESYQRYGTHTFPNKNKNKVEEDGSHTEVRRGLVAIVNPVSLQQSPKKQSIITKQDLFRYGGRPNLHPGVPKMWNSAFRGRQKSLGLRNRGMQPVEKAYIRGHSKYIVSVSQT